MSKAISYTRLSDTLSLTEYKDGFWLHDKTQSMNLSMRAKTNTDAFVEALTYYQKRLTKVEREYKELKTKVNAFVSQFVENDDE